MAKKKNSDQNSLEELKSNSSKKTENVVPEEVKNECLDSNRALKLQIIDQIEKINNRYYLLIVKKYIDNLGV